MLRVGKGIMLSIYCSHTEYKMTGYDVSIKLVQVNVVTNKMFAMTCIIPYSEHGAGIYFDYSRYESDLERRLPVLTMYSSP